MAKKEKVKKSGEGFFSKHKGLFVFLMAGLIAAVNFLVYPVFMRLQMNLVSVPVAKTTIAEGTLVTEDMLTTIVVDASSLPDGVRYGDKQVAGYYVKEGYTIPTNGFIYSESLSKEETAMGSTFVALGENEVAYTILIDNKYNQNNALRTGQKNDIYYYAEYEAPQGLRYIVGKLKANARVIGTTNLDKQSYITLAIDESEVGLFILAEQTGTLLPILDATSQDVEAPTDYYDVEQLKNFLSANHNIMRKIVVNNGEQQ